jgi:hypothetical protein
MAQSDLTIQNQSFPSFRADLNDALTALNSMQSGTSRPASAVAGTMWLDTTNATNPTIKFFDGTDDIQFATVNYSANTIDFLDSSLSTPITVTGSSSAGAEIRLPEDTDNGSNYVALKAPDTIASDLTLTLPATDGTAGQALTTDGSGALSFSTIQSPSGFRNIVINGDMQIAQRSTSVASITTSGYYTLDRWNIGASSLGTFTMSQSTDVPSGYGFANSLKLDNTTADASPAAGDYFQLNQLFEGQNLQYLKKGTANASPLTASFWVKSTKTGTFICELLDLDNSRQISKSYTVNTTNTWEFKTVTFAGDTTGTLNNDNGSSLVLSFWLGAGSTYTSGTLNTSWNSITNANRVVGQVNIADSTSNDWLITGVQLEAGTTDTDFEFLPIDVSLGRCKRYFASWGGTAAFERVANGTVFSSTQAQVNLTPFSVQMRSAPSLSVSSDSHFRVAEPTSAFACTALSINNPALNSTSIIATVASGLTTNRPMCLDVNSTFDARLTLSAEL